MTPDLQALLAAIVADPSDDVARLVYADCLEDSGNAARAQFIRLQIEAEHHHPDSAPRAELAHRAETLFVDHGFRWWVDVCNAVGIAPPQSVETDRDAIGIETPPPEELTNRFRQARVYWTAPGWTDDAFCCGYRARGCTVKFGDNVLEGIRPPGTSGFEQCKFRRGFPDQLRVLCGSYEGDISFAPAGLRLSQWFTEMSLTGLSLVYPEAEMWRAIHGPHLSRLNRLELINSRAGVVADVHSSQHLRRLDTLLLRIWNEDFCPAPPSHGAYLGEISALANASWNGRLRNLFVELPTVAATEALANASGLSGLIGLWVKTYAIPMGGPDDTTRTKLDIIAQSPVFSGLRELGITGEPHAFDSIVNGVFQRSLKTLQLVLSYSSTADELAALAQADAFPALEELRISQLNLTGAGMQLLRNAPVVRRVRHLHLHGWIADDADPWEILELVEPDRIETLRFEINRFPSDVAAALRARFGQRVSISEYNWQRPEEPI